MNPPFVLGPPVVPGCLRQSLFCAAGSARAAARQRREAAAQRHDVQRGGNGKMGGYKVFFWRHRTLDDTCDADTITINHQITIYHHKVIKDNKW